MSGEKIERDPTEEMLYRATLRGSFQKDIQQIRCVYDIPDNGFEADADAERWWVGDERSLEHKTNFNEDIWNLLSKYGLPQGADFLLESYILVNHFNFLPKLPKSFFACEYEDDIVGTSPTSMEQRWSGSGKRFVRVYISEDTSLPSVQEYLKHHWPHIRDSIFLKNKKQKTIRRSRNFKRDELIWEFYQKSRKELGLGRGEYRDIKVSSILNEKYGVEVTPENIRKIWQRMKRLRDN